MTKKHWEEFVEELRGSFPLFEVWLQVSAG